mmetsp:Transcript_5930/g.18671  ORF Transcript_5930/g.18671 Transcript_5930/m.18671 type:complete len:215 (+) Transcript_5930:359-1003(+)
MRGAGCRCCRHSGRPAKPSVSLHRCACSGSRPPRRPTSSSCWHPGLRRTMPRRLRSRSERTPGNCARRLPRPACRSRRPLRSAWRGGQRPSGRISPERRSGTTRSRRSTSTTSPRERRSGSPSEQETSSENRPGPSRERTKGRTRERTLDPAGSCRHRCSRGRRHRGSKWDSGSRPLRTRRRRRRRRSRLRASCPRPRGPRCGSGQPFSRRSSR